MSTTLALTSIRSPWSSTIARSSGPSGVSTGSPGLDSSVVSVGLIGSVIYDSVLLVGSVDSIGAADFVDSDVLGVVVKEPGYSPLPDVVRVSDSPVSEVVVSLDDDSIVSPAISSFVGAFSEVDGCFDFSS